MGSAVHLSVAAGILATAGSLFGKLAGSLEMGSMEQALLKITLFGVMILLNTAGCTFFVRSLQGCGSSLPSTVVSAATNYFCSNSPRPSERRMHELRGVNIRFN
ncbi:uncharacterized protein [Fopius arisanus]|uniref:GatB_2 protein n=1 Tax=Fopius arisanus TaxID=64838 RepID=A0A0C9QZS9_9HYME|nr:PREDICTED: uncharacterized protein LOC105264618 isoform X2 [Fopius arisanus]